MNAPTTFPAIEPDHLIDRAEVERRVGRRKSWIYDKIALGEFPDQVRFRNCRAVRWRASEIAQWVKENTLE